MKIKKTKKVEVEAKELRIYMKVCDQFSGSLHDDKGAQLCTQEDGYVPDFMPGEHYGDYVILNIDIETGQITNWKKPTAKAMQDFVAKCNGEESDE